MVQNLPYWDRRPSRADTEFADPDEDGGDGQNHAKTDGTETDTRQCLPGDSGKTVHYNGKKFQLCPFQERRRDRLRHHNRLLSQ